jgi:YfiH family protein
MDNSPNFIQYKIFQHFNNVLAFTSTKQTLEEKNARFTGDSSDVLKNNRKQLAHQLDIKANQLVFPRQTHTNCVAEVLDIPDDEISETDALVTENPKICLCVQTADCVPILLYDPVKNAISAIHAGWRGTLKKIVEVAIEKMIANYNCSPKNILAAIGPAISPTIYEVGDEVVQAVRKSIPKAEMTLQKNNSGKYHLNLWEANRQILLANGVISENIEIFDECSFQNNDKYFSARKEGINTGRIVTGIMLKS